MDWDKLKIFHTVAEAGSFTNASTVLNLSQSAISRQIQSLEKDLKIHLFERHARGLVLTSNGEYLYKTANDVISKLKDVESTLSEDKDKICYHESVYVKNQRMDLEDWLNIKRQNLGNLTLEYFYLLLKKSKKERLSFLKKFLTQNKIVYETGSWETIDYN